MEYVKGFVTFFDILGFQSIVKNKNAYEIKKIIDIFYQVSNRLSFKKFEYENNATMISFSDSIVRVGYKNGESPKDFCYTLYNELVQLSYIIISLIGYGVLVRGGVAYGDIYCNTEDRIVFGPSFIEAYKLEANVAKYPRIIIHPEIINCLKKFKEIDDECKKIVTEIINIFLSLDQDGLFFIDYLKRSINIQQFWTTSNLFERDIIAHRNIIRRNIFNNNSYNENIEIQQKYNWLTSYHNNILEKCPEVVMSREKRVKHIINEEDNPFFQSSMSILIP